MKGARGFTLIEVLLAASVLTTVLIAVSNLFIVAMKANAGAGDHTECVALAQERMERLKARSYAALAAGGDLVATTTGYFQYLDVDANGRNDYLVTWEVQDSLPMAGSKRIRVRAAALKGQLAQLGRPKQVTFSTYKANGGSV